MANFFVQNRFDAVARRLKPACAGIMISWVDDAHGFQPILSLSHNVVPKFTIDYGRGLFGLRNSVTSPYGVRIWPWRSDTGLPPWYWTLVFSIWFKSRGWHQDLRYLTQRCWVPDGQSRSDMNVTFYEFWLWTFWKVLVEMFITESSISKVLLLSPNTEYMFPPNKGDPPSGHIYTYIYDCWYGMPLLMTPFFWPFPLLRARGI